MKEALAPAKNMLAAYPCPLDRKCVFIVSEIAKQDKRHWYWDFEKEDFVPTVGIPPVLTDPVDKGEADALVTNVVGPKPSS
jgi:hypothetical protein